MNLEAVIVGAVIGVAVGWLARRWLAAARAPNAAGISSSVAPPIPAAAILEGGYSDDLPLLVEAFLSAWDNLP